MSLVIGIEIEYNLITIWVVISIDLYEKLYYHRISTISLVSALEPEAS
jgi:hypothetical protein